MKPRDFIDRGSAPPSGGEATPPLGSVLASGARPSAYAGHLLEVVSGVSPARWTPSCRLAMARKSSLEGRLVAVLNENLNRRGVSATLAAIALAVAAGIAVPIAMVRAADEQPAEQPNSAAAEREPRHEYAQSLFKRWQANARTDGKIPGALIGQVAREMDSFFKQRPQDERASKLAALRPRLDASHDWTQADVVALLDDITAIATAPVSWAESSLKFEKARMLLSGQPLPDNLTSAEWGQPAANGMRAAWLLEPRAEQYPLGSVLKARVLFHNTGNAPVVFKTETWHQFDPHTASDAQGAELKVSGTHYTGYTPMAAYRLAPGEYCEVGGHGVAIGAAKYEEEFSVGSVGAIVEAKEGDEVTLSHSVDTTHGGWTRPNDPKDPAELWKKDIADRVKREAPMPSAAVDREQLIRRVTLDIFGEPPSTEDVTAFIVDNSPDALAKLTVLLQAKPRIELFSGKLPTGQTKFRVTAADPNAAKAPRTASAPGRYVLGENVRLQVTQITSESFRTNKATILFLSPDPGVASPQKAFEIALPDGIGTYGIVWERGAGVLWLAQQGLVRSIDFTNPAQVQETRFEPASIANVPDHLRDALRKAFDMPGATGQGAQLQQGMEETVPWGEPVNGLRAAIVIRPVPGEAKTGDMPDLYLVVQNVSDAPVRLSDAKVSPRLNLRTLYLKIDGKIQMGLGAREPALADLMLQPREAAFLPMFSPDSMTLDGHATGSLIAEGALQDSHQTLIAELQIENAPAGAWTGKLITGETSGATAAGKPQPKDKKAQALFKVWQDNARGNGNIPGGLVGGLGEKVKEFIRNNTGDASGDSYAKKMAPLAPRFDAARDCSPAEAVALLDDIAAVSDIPLQTTLWADAETRIQSGQPLPADLKDAPWGEPTAEGLRAARPLDPRSESYPVGLALRTRILLHNDGKEPLLLRAKSWMQPGHTARDAAGNPLQVESTYWTTLGRVQTWRLAPGEFCEIATPGLGVGKDAGRDEWADVRVGSWIDVAAGVDVTLHPGSSHTFIDDGRASKPANGRELKLEIIHERLAREFPLPASAADREQVVRRVTKDVFGGEPTPDEVSAFVTDKSDDPFAALGERLLRRAGLAAFVGSVKPGKITFRTTPADPEAASRPKVAIGPGRYSLDENVRLIIVGKPIAGRRTSDVKIRFWAADPNGEPPGKHYKIQVPDGFGTWAITCRPRTGILWVLTNGAVRKIDYSNPAQVKETPIKPGSSEDMPGEFREAVKRILAIHDIPAGEQEALLSTVTATAAPASAAPK